MKIGIDIDGVLEDVEKFQIEYGSKYFYEKYNKDIINPDRYSIKTIFDVTQDLEDEFWKVYIKEYAINGNAKLFASEVIQKLKKEKNEIYIITARTGDLSIGLTNTEMQTLVRMWLQQNNIYYDRLIFSPEDKLETCINNKIDLMIEDKPENINKISTVIPVICFDASYNKLCRL